MLCIATVLRRYVKRFRARKARAAQGLIRRWWCFGLRMRWVLHEYRPACTAIQREFRRFYHRRFFTDLRSAQLTISRAWRAALTWRLQRLVASIAHQEHDTQWWAAGEIQRVVRGHWARKRAQAQRDRNALLHLCAVRVQLAWYRRNNQFTAYVLLRSLVVQHNNDVEMQLTCRRQLRTCAASNIQAAWRCVSAGFFFFFFWVCISVYVSVSSVSALRFFLSVSVRCHTSSRFSSPIRVTCAEASNPADG